MTLLRTLATITLVTVWTSGSALAQVGRSMGVVDANTSSEQTLLALPHMTPAIVSDSSRRVRSPASSHCRRTSSVRS